MERPVHIPVRFAPNAVLDEPVLQFLHAFTDESQEVKCYTSGSTGTPKEIWVQKKRMIYSARKTVQFFALNADSNALLALPARYIAGRMMLVRAMVSGMQLSVVQPSLNPIKHLDCSGLDFAAFTPAQVHEMLAEPETAEKFKQIKSVIIGGAALDDGLERKLAGFPNAIYVSYGMTETLSHIALRRVGEPFYTLISNQTRISVNADSCLQIEDPNLTDETLQTTDVVNIVDEMHFEWLGRHDFVINSGGVKLHPERIEKKIKQLPGWENLPFFISSKPDSQFGERPILIYEEQTQEPDISVLKSVLDKFEWPAEFHPVPQFVYTETGKLNRKAVLALLG